MKLAWISFCLLITFSLLATPQVSGDLVDNNLVLEAGNFADVIFSALPLCDAALIIGIDGTAVYIPSYAFQHATLEEINGLWNLQSDYLSPVTNIRNIAEICLQQVPAKYSIKFQNSEFIQISPFQYRLGNFDFWGESEKNDYSVKKYKFRSETDYWDNLSVQEIITRSGQSYKTAAAQISFQNYYFKAKNDTISTIILQSKESK